MIFGAFDSPPLQKYAHFWDIKIENLTRIPALLNIYPYMDNDFDRKQDFFDKHAACLAQNDTFK